MMRSFPNHLARPSLSSVSLSAQEPSELIYLALNFSLDSKGKDHEEKRTTKQPPYLVEHYIGRSHSNDPVRAAQSGVSTESMDD